MALKLWHYLGVLTASSLLVPGIAADSRFGVVGDVPYGESALTQFPALVSSIESSAVNTLIHVGDIKGGSASCRNDMLSSRVQAITEINTAVIFIPGDNDWTDCHRRRAGGYSPLERLAKLRSLAYPKIGESLGAQPIAVQSQATIPGFAEFPEHQYWQAEAVSYTTLHVLGSDNGLAQFRGRTEADDDEAQRRIAASISWLETSFARASSSGSEALIVAIHGNPLGMSERRAAKYPVKPFAGFLTALYEGAVRFQKPVLLAHGDTHDYKFDQPIQYRDDHPDSGKTVANLYRLEGIGSPAIGWVEVTISATSTTPFTVTPHFIKR